MDVFGTVYFPFTLMYFWFHVRSIYVVVHVELASDLEQYTLMARGIYFLRMNFR